MKRTPLKRGGPLKRRPKKRRDGDGREVMAENRAAVFAEAGMRCQADGLHVTRCFDDGNLVGWMHGHVHHRKPVSLGGGDEPTNLLWVHPDCHATIHSHPAAARELGLLKTRYDE